MPLHVILSVTLTVFTAADLVPALRALAARFERSTQATVVLVPGSTGTLTQQLRNGAPADLFFSADQAAPDALVREGLAEPSSRVQYARGLLALVTPPPPAPSVRRLADLGSPAIRRIAMANPAHAPYGLAARRALERAGLWAAVQSKLVYGENVQQAAQFVRSGSVDAGIVARSLVGGSELSWTMVDPTLYTPLAQSAVVMARSAHKPLARSFLELVTGPAGAAVLQQFGFLPPGGRQP